MFDGHFRADAERTLKPVGHKLKRAGITADHLPVLGVLMAVGAAVAIGAGALRLGLVLLVLTTQEKGVGEAVGRGVEERAPRS